MHRLLLAIIVAALTGGSAGKTINKANPTAAEILRRTAQSYASCKSYRDTGTVTSVGQNYRSTLRFQTAFARPDRFRFEYNTSKDDPDGPTRHVVWTRGGKAFSWWTVDPKVIEEDSLAMAVAGATGVSSMSAHTVPRLLMPGKVTGWAVTDLVSPRLLGTEPVDGAVCFEIEGHDWRGGTVTMWITKRSYLIRKIQHRHQSKQDHFVDTTVYQPELDINLPASAFESRVEK